MTFVYQIPEKLKSIQKEVQFVNKHLSAKEQAAVCLFICFSKEQQFLVRQRICIQLFGTTASMCYSTFSYIFGWRPWQSDAGTSAGMLRQGTTFWCSKLYLCDAILLYNKTPKTPITKPRTAGMPIDSTYVMLPVLSVLPWRDLSSEYSLRMLFILSIWWMIWRWLLPMSKICSHNNSSLNQMWTQKLSEIKLRVHDKIYKNS